MGADHHRPSDDKCGYSDRPDGSSVQTVCFPAADLPSLLLRCSPLSQEEVEAMSVSRPVHP